MAKQKRSLTREDILGAKDLPIGEVYVPQWGGVVHLRTLTGTQQDEFEACIAGVPGTRFMRARYVAAVVCDAEGNPLFTRGEADALEKKSAGALTIIMKAALKHNGMTEEEIGVEEKNSETAPDSETGSD